MSTLREIISETDFNSCVSMQGLVLVDFYATWCEPCKWLEEILMGLQQQLSSNATIVKIDAERFSALGDQFNVRSVPVLVLFRNGEVVWRMNGFMTGPELYDKVISFR